MIAALLTLFASQALFQPGLPTSADLAIHLHRTLEFERAWGPGVIVPRWAPNLAFGYGYPLFVFAPPLPYLLALGFHQLGLSLEATFKALLSLSLGLYAGGMYLLVRDCFRSQAAGVVAAAVYAFAPFALREALLVGGNIPQLLAIGLFPWPLWAISRAIRSGSWGWTVLAAALYAGIMLSHLFQVFVFTPVLALYSLAQWAIERRKEPAARFWPGLLPLAAIPLGLLLSAFFWIPAFTERYATRAQADIYLEKSPFFVRYPYWPELVAWIYPLDGRAANPYMPLSLGVVTLVLAGLGLLAGGWRLWRFVRAGRRQGKAESSMHSGTGIVVNLLFFAVVAGGAIFMSLPLSRPVWETVEILQVAEFPWRMLGLANLGLGVLAGGALLLVPGSRRWWVAVPCLLLQLVAVAPLLYPVTGFTRFFDLRLSDTVGYERRSQSIGTTTLGEYLPRTVSRPPSNSPLVAAFEAGETPERLDRESLPAAAQASLLAQTAVTHRYQIQTPNAFTLRFLQFDYPGWRAELDGQPVPITPEPETGLILIEIPAGEHRLTLHFGETPGRLVAMSLTGLTLLGLLGFSLARSRGWLRQKMETAGRPQSLPEDRLSFTSPLVLGGLALIIVGALGLKPLLRPVFTLDSPLEQALPAQYQADVRFHHGVRLIGYDLSRRTIRPDSTIQVVLYWQTDNSAALSRLNLQPFVHLDRLDDFTTVADSTNYTPGDVTTETNLPTFHWDNERYIRDEHDLTIPPEAPPLAYALRVGLADPDQGGARLPLAGGEGDTAWIDILHVTPLHSPPPLAQALEVAFQRETETIHLTGFQLDKLSSEQVAFTLAWRVEEQPQGDYTVFAQLLDKQGQLVASFDRPPLDGAYPTSAWLPGQTIHDPRTIPLDGTPPGRYQLIVGLYETASGQRLKTMEGSDFVTLSTLTLDGSAP